MQIRCERCQAECALDASQLRDGTADVQCSVCGHIFTAAQPGSNETGDGASAGSADTGNCFLRTADGGVHRFPGLASLHKLIIERRVTRMDRVSPDGQAWQYAGQIDDLVPFFEVVDEADHARSGAAAAQSQSAQVEPARRSSTSPTRGRSSPQAVAISIPNDGVRLSFPAAGKTDTRGASYGHGRGGLKIFVGLTVAAGVAYAGIQWQEGRIHSAAMGAKASGGIWSWRRILARPPEARPDPGAGSGAGQVPNEMAAPSPSTKGPVVEELPSPPPAETEEASNTPSPAKPAAAPAEAYEKLVADADRALENGSNSTAKDLYQRALRLRPGGVRALSGLGFAALDRGQIPAAYGFFKRALGAKTSYGPALFGMGEVRRARGEKALALQSYQRYLQLWPNGSDAATVRRKAKMLQAGK